MNRVILCLLLLAAGFSSSACAKSPRADMSQTLWYDKPAVQWEEMLPLGNGRLGMMPDGGVDSERIVLNEITMWSGSEADYGNTEAASYLPKIQQLLFDGKNHEAQQLMYKYFVPVMPGNGGTYGCYQLLADLEIEYEYPTMQAAHSYVRRLDLDRAVATTQFLRGNNSYLREYWVSRSKDVVIVRLTATEPFSFRAGLSRPERATVRRCGEGLSLEGVLDSGVDTKEGVRFQARMEVLPRDGILSAVENSLRVDNTLEALIVVSAATSYEHSDYRARCEDLLQTAQTALAESSDKLLENDIADHRMLYRRSGLTLRENPQTASLPTDERLGRFEQQDDPGLAALYYNFGRYLLIGSTRPGSLPPNLQGLWANTCKTPWNGDYHLNINVQMNHWPAEPTNLSELHLPLIELTRSLVSDGERTAKIFYGAEAEGWVAHMKTNVWRFTAPGEHPSWGATNTGGAWLCAHLWEHYLFSENEQYLREIYPVMKGAASFFLSTMVKEPKHGWLVTAPSSSPENAYLLPEVPAPISVCMGPTMDTQLVRELYGNVIAASRILGVDEDYCARLEDACRQLPPYRFGKEGRLQEWLEDYEEQDPHHRHVSHLYGLYPGTEITPEMTPELAAACRKTLERRGDEGTGWSRAWKICFWARLGDGNRAYRLLKSLLTPAYTSENPKHGSGTYPNLFCSHAPMQIDGNFGGTAGIGEMLLQSKAGYIHLLPAIPDAWECGELNGYRVVGGGCVDVNWAEGRVQKVRFSSDLDKVFRFKTPEGVRNVTLLRGKKKTAVETGPYFNLKMAVGESVELVFK